MDLMMAVMSGDISEVKKCLANGEEPDSIDENGRTPLMAAVYKNLTSLAEVLIEAGSDLYAKDKEGYPVMYYAAVHGNFETTVLLYQKNIQFNRDTETYKLTLAQTKANGHNHIVEFLEAAINNSV
jgi:ankyrin repeat protein